MRERVEVGDWSNDGHNQSDTKLIDVPHGVDTKDAYVRGEQIVGFKLDDFCEEYEDSSFPVEHLKSVFEKARELSVPISFGKYDDLEIINEDGFDAIFEGEYPIAEKENNTVYLSPDSYFGIWLAILNIGIVAARNGELGLLAYEVVESDNTPVHYIGGYGLYHC